MDPIAGAHQILQFADRSNNLAMCVAAVGSLQRADKLLAPLKGGMDCRFVQSRVHIGECVGLPPLHQRLQYHLPTKQFSALMLVMHTFTKPPDHNANQFKPVNPSRQFETIARLFTKLLG